jgi:uncharacterized cupredoxin-like copper-binding protein
MISESTRSKRRARGVLLLLATIAFFSYGCAESGGPPSREETQSSTVTLDAESDEVLVEIDLDEYFILMDAAVPSGPVSLMLANRGFEEHNLYFTDVESDSTIWETEGRLSPGERRTVTLDLEPGVYQAVCDFSGHESRGMVAEFVVEDATPAEPGS